MHHVPVPSQPPSVSLFCYVRRDRPNKPFRCLDPQYRRELVRVYLTNVEGVCRRFADDKRGRLLWAREEAHKFRDFWKAVSPDQQRKLLLEKGEVICKVHTCILKM